MKKKMSERLDQILKDSLESNFHIGFKVVSLGPNQFVISLEKGDDRYFKLHITTSAVRIKIKLDLEKHARELLYIINQSSLVHRKNFVEIWQKMSENISVSINQQELSQEQFLINSDSWKSFEIKYNYIYSDDEDFEQLLSQRVVYICSMMLSLFDYAIEGYKEGEEIVVTETHKKHERNRRNRILCLAIKGYTCSVCGINFKDVYGDIGKDYIEIHHHIPVASMKDGHIVNISDELFPLCSNCHSMVHRRNPPYSIEELRSMIEENKK